MQLGEVGRVVCEATVLPDNGHRLASDEEGFADEPLQRLLVKRV
jgi:hypothetical protein